ncbi:MAG TPA: tyrosine-protein phosphatase [Chloroflexota bacterium]|nr:tyrosine-protein phosphatase [Chloroflexota bacterium]HUM70319.1 tyrosine-protein phosphatase [Chloroflexota bacterium]
MRLKSWFTAAPPELHDPVDWILPLPTSADGHGPANGRPPDRFLPLQGGINFRDIGGYETVDGRTIRWGLVYRAGVLSGLTPADQQYLGQFGIRLVCDLRTESEVQKRPDKLPGNPECQWLHLPIENMERSARLRGLVAVLFNRSQLDNLMDEGYTRVMIDENGPLIGQALRLMVNATNRPIVIHCSAGKDRTAVIIALLLHILGVPQETILADYALSNLHYDKFRAGIQQDLHRLERWGITVDHLQAVILVKATRLEKTWAHIERKYGSITGYLEEQAGISQQTMHQLRASLLT